ncbi:hypothetical protein TNCT_732801 [Trichonephila clavata]|uniref:Uncharacterized protein n=1 Tax=Trichonephila clavata TaxID=2740835 RepID=A0A8X6I126_TRICU|nr:hypothetical protein TNCT_732801 [Trichonephila clavata]
MTTVEEHIPIVHSLAIWKMCEALDLKVKLVLLPESTALPRIPHRDIDQTTTVPVVGSFSVWKICQALIFQPLTTHRLSKLLFFVNPTRQFL